MHHRSTATAAAALAIALCASLPARAQTARLGGLPASAQVVTNEQDAAALAALNAANAVISAALTNEAALRVEGDAAGLAAVNATNAVLSAAITNEAALRAAGDAAGLAAVNATNDVLRAALTNEAALRAAGDAAGLAAVNATNAVLSAAITNEAALRAAHTNRTDNPHGVTAAQIGALTAEQDLAALRAYHYGSPDIVESPAEWFGFDGAGTIIGFGYSAGRENVVIPWAIGGVPVTAIGADAFKMSGIVSVIAPKTVTMIGVSAFGNCTSLTSVSLPQAQTIGENAFGHCSSLASIPLPQAQTIGSAAFDYCILLASVRIGQNAPAEATYVFYGITPPPTVYVTDPQATGWGAEWNGAPVVRLPLYADAIYQAGELVATTGHVAQAIAAIPEPDLSDRPTFAQIAASNALPYTAWTGTVTPADGTATVAIAHGNMPVLVTSAPCVLTLDPTGYGTAGVSRVSLSYYPGTNSFTFATNVITYSATPNVDTNGWNTLLIRRVSNGTWKGVGL